MSTHKIGFYEEIRKNYHLIIIIYAAYFFCCLFQTYMHEKISSDQEWVPSRCLHLLYEILSVKLVNLLNIPEDHVPLSPQCLGQIFSVHLRDVVLDDEAE